MSKATHVTSVLDLLDVILFRTQPPGVFIRALGEVPTTGWTNPALVPRQYVKPPSDGIQEFDFFAAPPDGIVLQVISQIEGEGTMHPLPDWAEGIRVVAATNELEYPFPAFETLFDGKEKDLETDDDEALRVTTSQGDEATPLLPEDWPDVPLATTEGKSCRTYKLGSVNIPETKTVFELRCVAKNPFNGKCIAKTKVPIIYRRTSQITLYADICVPDDKAIWKEIKDCVEQAVIAGVVASLVTKGNLAAGAAALKAYLIACLKAKTGQAIEDIEIRLRRTKVPGPWKKL